MNNNSWFKKENPFQTVIGFGGGATGFGAYSSSASKTYVDDVFSTDVWTGNETARTISTGVDNNKGAIVWVKSRNDGHDHHIVDTVRGANELLYTNSTAAQANTANRITAFTNDGYTIGSAGQVNGTSAYTYGGWNFRKKEGFCDIVTWTGDSNTNQTISHSLGSIPGMIITKCTSDADDWWIYHRGVDSASPQDYAVDFGSGSRTNSANFWNDTAPTSTEFTAGSAINTNSRTYVAYVLAGGEDQGNASVDFSGTDDRLTWESNSDVNFGTGDFTVEFWLRKPDGGSTHTGFFQISGTGGGLDTNYSSSLGLGWHQSFNCWQLYRGGGYTNSSSAAPTANQWYHAAVVRSSGTTKVYIDGTEVISLSDTHDYNYNNLVVGGYYNTDYLMKGNISNFRITKGQALYTSSFTPTTSPLTTTSQSATASNVKLLCCNDIGASGFTKSPSPLTLTGSPQGIKVSPFAASTATDASAVFGADEDQNVIKCGTYIGNGSSSGATINLGWEPQWLLIKNTDLSSESWWLLDDIRGIVSGSTEATLQPNVNNAEWEVELIELTSTGFKCTTADDKVNGDGHSYIYTAIRRPDGYVGKPVETGTGAFFINYLADADDPSIRSSTFPADFGIAKTTAIVNSWNASARLIQGQALVFDTSDALTTNSNWQFDYMNGANEYNNPSVVQIGYLLKRHKGFDVVNYTGTGIVGQTYNHSLGTAPEMVWIKRKTAAGQWVVGHKGLNGGTNPWEYSCVLDATNAEADSPHFNDTAPTSTVVTVGNHGYVNEGTSDNYLMLLFASVEGVSKVGYYDGSDSEQTITTGFQPRFVIIKCATDAFDWLVFDTTRGWGSGNDQRLRLNDTSANYAVDVGAPTSTGFTLTNPGDGSEWDWNDAGKKYIYYAHA